jgi:Transposase and inactivated derivatives
MVQLNRHLGERVMSKKRKQYSAEYKTKVVLELLQGDLTAAQVASKYEITAKSLTDWKKQFLENASLAFDLSGATKSYKDEIETLKEENDALAKNWARRPLNAIGQWES